MKNKDLNALEWLCPSVLVPYEKNSRTHDEAQIAQICASITEFGFTNPVLIDAGGRIVAGHGRVEAAKKLELDLIPCYRLGYLTADQVQAYVLADNRIALNAGWNTELLAQELQALQEKDFNLSLLGFEDDELSQLLALGDDLEEALADENSSPEPPKEPVSKLGDIWYLGDHVLVCGDSTEITTVDKIIADGSADLVFTDPPYGMNYGGGKGGRLGEIKNDDLEGDDLKSLIQNSLGIASEKKKEGAAIYVCFTWRTHSIFEQAIKNIELETKALIVWDKKYIGLGNQEYRPQHEFIFYCSGQWYGNKDQSDVWALKRDPGKNYQHPTQKPVELVEKALSNSSKSGDLVYDPFGGSGSTLIACEKMNRKCRMIELDPRYVDVIIQRWQEFTGKKAFNQDKIAFKDL